MDSTAKRIENTKDRSPFEHLAGMLDGNYITDMESAGQRQLVQSSQLPIQGPWDELISLGFVKGENVDDLFCEATLPAGWSKEGSDHAMWSYLLDERGIRRVGVFYKAAFYDRKADMRFQHVGYSASGDVLHGDDVVALPEKWAVFTEAERADFISYLDEMDENIKSYPDIYGKYADRLAAARKLVADVSS